MQITEVKTYKQLEQFIAECKQEGFNLNVRDWEVHNSKLDSIINAANTLKLECRYDQLRKLYKDSYAQFEAEIQNHFFQFNQSDKLKEVSRNLAIVPKYTSQWTIFIVERKKTLNQVIAEGFIPNDENRPIDYYWEAIDLSGDPTKIKFRCQHSSTLNDIFTALGLTFQVPYYNTDGYNFNGLDGENFKLYKNGNFTISNVEVATALLNLAKLRYLNQDCYLIKQ